MSWLLIALSIVQLCVSVYLWLRCRHLRRSADILEGYLIEYREAYREAKK